MNMYQHPAIPSLVVDLRFSTIGLQLCGVLLLLRGGEVPGEFGPRGIAVDVHLDAARRQLTVGNIPPIMSVKNPLTSSQPCASPSG